MFKRFLFLVILFTVSPAVSATVLTSGPFSFELPGKWKVVTEKSGAKSAHKLSKKDLRAFIVSIYHPRSRRQVGVMLDYLHNYLKSLDKENKLLKKETELTSYKSARGAPFEYIVYSDKTHHGFFIGVSQGSNAGVMLITYEGKGNTNEALKELKRILDSIKYKKS